MSNRKLEEENKKKVTVGKQTKNDYVSDKIEHCWFLRNVKTIPEECRRRPVVADRDKKQKEK